MKPLLLPLAVLVAAGCQPDPATTSAPATASPAATSAATAGASTAPGGATLPFTDDFSDQSSGWGTGSAPDLAYQIQYVNGGLAILINKPSTAYTRLSFAPAVGSLAVSVEAQRIGGQPDGGTYGPTCNLDGRTFYAFYVGDDGRHGIVRVEDGVEAILERKPAGSDLPLAAGEINTIGAVCSKAVGGPVNLSLFVNGTESILSASDPQPLGEMFSGFGLGAANDAEAQFVVQFDDLSAEPNS